MDVGQERAGAVGEFVLHAGRNLSVCVEYELTDRTELDIRIMPPLYATWWAFVLYALLLALAVWLYIHFVRSRERLKAQIRIEQQQAQQAEENNQSKLRFFTNVSHEFRTPLTLIVGQLDMLLQQPTVPPLIYNRVLSIRRNAVNMQNLINELLEFRKVEQGHLSLHVAEHDVVRFAHEVYLSFSDYAKSRDITYRFLCQDEHIMMWYDETQLQKVLYNLLSNAFKYTPQGASITLSLEAQVDQVLIRVADTGVGISTTDIKRIFDRFYQAENGVNMSNLSPGTGIGLALSKSVVADKFRNVRLIHCDKSIIKFLEILNICFLSVSHFKYWILYFIFLF